MSSPEATPGAAGVVARLVERGETLATAESLTGGLVGVAMTEVPGSSAAFRGGLVVYATDLKERLAHVSSSTLARFGAVSAETAAELAAGAAHVCGATWGIGTTGVAGPDPQDGRPVGTVFVALARADGVAAPAVLPLALQGTREQIRRQTVEAALGLLTRALT